MRAALPLLVALIIAGCAAPVNFSKAGAGAAEYEADMRFCEYEATKYGSPGDRVSRTAIGAGIEDALRIRDMKIACMKSKGWEAS